jgi:hypothetical protein
MELDTPQAPFSGLRTTEIEVSTDSWTKESLQSPATVYAKSMGSNINEKSRNTSHRDQYSVTISSANATSPHAPKSTGFKASSFLPRRPNSMDKIKWAYTKCALLFAISILITWVPASVNRVYGYVHPPFPLRLAPRRNRQKQALTHDMSDFAIPPILPSPLTSVQPWFFRYRDSGTRSFTS